MPDESKLWQMGKRFFEELEESGLSSDTLDWFLNLSEEKRRELKERSDHGFIIVRRSFFKIPETYERIPFGLEAGSDYIVEVLENGNATVRETLQYVEECTKNKGAICAGLEGINLLLDFFPDDFPGVNLALFSSSQDDLLRINFDHHIVDTMVRREGNKFRQISTLSLDSKLLLTKLLIFYKA